MARLAAAKRVLAIFSVMGAEMMNALANKI